MILRSLRKKAFDREERELGILRDLAKYETQIMDLRLLDSGGKNVEKAFKGLVQVSDDFKKYRTFKSQYRLSEIKRTFYTDVLEPIIGIPKAKTSETRTDVASTDDLYKSLKDIYTRIASEV